MKIESIAYFNLWDTLKKVLREKCIHLSAYIFDKKERVQINNNSLQELRTARTNQTLKIEEEIIKKFRN